MVAGLGMNYGYGMNGGYPQMVQAYGNSQQEGNVPQRLRAKYGCDDCFDRQPYFAQYPIPVQEVPQRVVEPTLFSRMIKRIFGGT